MAQQNRLNLKRSDTACATSSHCGVWIYPTDGLECSAKEELRLERHLATILAADVVGYSKLMANDEEATVRTLQSHRQIIDSLIERHGGRIFNTAGDAVLAEFRSAVESVRCALAIQEELRMRNAELPAERQMLFRIGINIGDVLANGKDLLGDGVNIAARLEGIAPPGGVCISGSTFEQVKNKLSVGFEDMGPQQVKNIPEPVSAFRLTSGPVSVASATAEENKQAKSAPARLPQIAAAAVAASIIIGLVAWLFWPVPPVTLEQAQVRPSTPPIEKSTGDEIKGLITGITISGKRKSDGQSFSIAIEEDGIVIYRLGSEDDPVSIVGRWWVENTMFCMQVRQFLQGRPACPIIVEKDGELTARRRRDGAVLPWRLAK
jgi:class 3 adenylate cyclase